MTPSHLRNRFRLDCNDKAVPPLWSDDEITDYTNWAIKQFCIGWGGFVDSTSSSITVLKAVAGQPFTAISDKILKIKQAWRTTDYEMLRLYNLDDLTRPRFVDDYGFALRQVFDQRTGPVYGLVLGMEKYKVRWVNVPDKDYTINISVLRMPLKDVCCTDSEKLEVPDEFLETILFGMKSLGYLKQDAETFDKSKATEFLALFNQYVKQARSVREARESKVRAVAYGGC